MAFRYKRKKNMARNFVSGFINRLVMSFFPFIIRTIMIQVMGAEYLGLNSLFTSILNVLSLSELGVGAAMVYEMYKPIAEGDKSRVCALLNFYKHIYRIIGAVILCVGLILLPFLNDLIKGDYPPDINIYILYVIYLFNTVITYWLFAYKTALLRAHQRLDIINNIDSIVHLASYSLQIILLVSTRNYYAYIIILPVFTVINNLVDAVYVKKIYPEYVESGSLSKESQHTIFTRIKALFGHKLGGVLVNSTDNIVISMSLGLTSVALYNNYYQIYSLVASIVDMVYTSSTAGIGNTIALDGVDKNYKDFKKFSFYSMWLIMWCCCCLLCLYQDFMLIWMGEQYLFGLSTVILLTISFYVRHIRKVVLTYKDAAGMWYADKFKPIFEGIANLVLNLILVRFLGINGIVIGTILAMGIVGLPWETYVLFKGYFKKSIRSYYQNLAIDSVLSLIVCAATFCLCKFVATNIYFQFIIKGFICVIVPNLAFLFIFRKRYETKNLATSINNWIAKRKGDK